MVGAMIIGAISFIAEIAGWYDGSSLKIIFFVELICMVSFGIAWIVAGKQLRFFASLEESEGME